MTQSYEIKTLSNGKRQIRYRDEAGRQRAKNFSSLERARHWRAEKIQGEKDLEAGIRARESPTLGEVIDEWKRRAWPAMGKGTKVRYENLLRLHFGTLKPLRVRAITAKTIDGWLDHLKEDLNRYGKAKIRRSFKGELTLLTTILNYYREYADDEGFAMPVMERHRKAAKLRNRPKPAAKDLSEVHFRRFLEELRRGLDGELMCALATVQFYHALRISEAAAVHWEDVQFDHAEPWKSRLVFSRHILYLRSKEHPVEEEAGFKNSEDGDSVKEHPMAPEVYQALRSLRRGGATGLIFRNRWTGECFTYRTVCGRYDSAFRRAGLPYRATHVMRHGGTRETYDRSGGDIGVAQQLLGNRSRQTVDVYAQRSALALTRHVQSRWAKEPCASNVHAQGVGLSLVKDSE